MKTYILQIIVTALILIVGIHLVGYIGFMFTTSNLITPFKFLRMLGVEGRCLSFSLSFLMIILSKPILDEICDTI